MRMGIAMVIRETGQMRQGMFGGLQSFSVSYSVGSQSFHRRKMKYLELMT
jgi:hypothetical protein